MLRTAQFASPIAHNFGLESQHKAKSAEPLSVYVLNHRFDRAPDAAHDHDFNKLGEHAIVWTERERTYAVVASRRLSDLHHAAAYVRRSVE